VSATIEERYAAVIAYKTKADAESKARKAERDLSYFELEMRLAEEYGPLGDRFLMFSVPEGHVAVTRVDAIHVKQYDDARAKAAKEGKALTTGQMLAFAQPGIIHPDAETFRKWVLGTGPSPKELGADGIVAQAVECVQRLHRMYQEDMSLKT